MSKLDWIRFWLHVPVGIICAGLMFFMPWHGAFLTVGFLAYEAMNDWRKKDSSYKDIFGFLFGFGGASILLLLRILILLQFRLLPH